MLLLYLCLIPLLFLTWAISSPSDALGWIRIWKRRFDGHVERRAIKRSISQFVKQFGEKAKRLGYEPEVIDEIIAEYLPDIAERIETKHRGEYLR